LASDTLIRFAGFELDPAARSLRHSGLTISLGPKTFDLLVYLTEHPNQLVTKDQLLSAVWPNSFVEESNLSQHVFLLRKALAAGAHADQVVVTVPGKGYHFSAAVEKVPRAIAVLPRGELLLHAVQSVTRVVVEEEHDDEEPELLALPAPAKVRGRKFWLVAAAALGLLAAGGILAWLWLRPVPAEHIELVLSDIENTTGEPAFDRVLNRALTIDLEQSPFLNLLSRSKTEETLKQMQRKKDEPLTPAVALEICERNNAQAMLHGSISKFGSNYLVILDATSCVSGQQIAGYKAEASTQEAVLGALDTAAGRVRKQLGESAASLEKFQTPIAQATTPSLDALRAYSQANERFEQGDIKAAQGLLERAVALDPNFASAYRLLSIMLYNRQDFVQATALIQKAYDLRDRATERERLSIEIAYNAYGVSDYEATIRSMKLFNQIYPNDAGNWSNLANMYTQLGEYPQAIEAGEHAYRIDPRAGVVAQILARAYKRANRFADARRVANAAVAAGRDHWGTHSILFQIAYAEHDTAGIKSDGEWGLSHQAANESLDDLGFAAGTSGKLHEAIDDFERARTEAQRGGDTDFADAALIDLAGVEMDVEEPAQATPILRQIKPGESIQADLATLEAEAGNLEPAQKFVAATLARTDTKDTVLLYCRLPWMRALLALKAHKPTDAVQLLEPARPYQMRDFSVPYLRARAETEAGQFDAAAEDYRLILDNQGIDPISPVYSLSHLRLARVLATQKKTADARKEYQAFFDAWKGADADLPLLQDARLEFAKLQ